MNTPAITIQNLSRRFGSVVALDSVSLEIQPGELFFLLGPSGCGKTTLLRILAGLEKADSGRILFDGQDIADRPPHERGVPMVFQNYALWPHLTVAENIAFGLVERRVPRAEIVHRVRDALAQVELEGLGDRRPSQLSGGQQQRVVLARALVLKPRIVLLDEPLSNLDAKLRLEMRETIGSLHARTDITFVYVTHDQAEALSLADRMAVLSQGRVLAVGAPAVLYHRPPNRFCASFLGEANLFRVVLERPLAPGPVTLATPFGPLEATAVAPLSGAALCMIRPEHLRPVSAALPDSSALRGNRLEARISQARMLGALLAIQLEPVGDGLPSPLRAMVLNRPETVRALHPGQTLAWTIAPEETILLPESLP